MVRDYNLETPIPQLHTLIMLVSTWSVTSTHVARMMRIRIPSINMRGNSRAASTAIISAVYDEGQSAVNILSMHLTC